MVSNLKQPVRSNGSIFTLLHPRGQLALAVGILVVALLGGWVSVSRLNMPLWSAAAATVALLALPALRKWHADRAQLGIAAMILSVLLFTQSVHTVEHVAQWVQHYMLGWPLKASSGLISPLNAELVHFSWNMAVLLAVIALLRLGMRNGWMWLLVVWAAAHSAEHSYMLLNYLVELQRLAGEGLPPDAAQGLPGFFGRGGWLATNTPTSGPIALLCTIAPALTSAPRLDVHFWWNVGEVALLLPAAHASMRHHGRV